MRSHVGALQWISSQARPDVDVPVSTIARYAHLEPTTLLVKAIKKLWKFLYFTKDDGIFYSYESE